MCNNIYTVTPEGLAMKEDRALETIIWHGRDGHTVSISVESNGLTASEFVDRLVEPLMLAISYHPHSVDEALCGDNYGDDSLGV